MSFPIPEVKPPAPDERARFVIPVGTDGVPVNLAGTASTPSAAVQTVQPPAVTEVRSTALEASKIIKASPGQLCSLAVFSNAAGFILLMNSATLPANGAVSLLYPPIPIAADQIVVLDLPRPLVASTGIVACISSTGSFTKTIGGSTCAFYAQFN